MLTDFSFPFCVGSVKDHRVGKEEFFFFFVFFQGANILLNDQGEVKLGRWPFALRRGWHDSLEQK